jgi:hypothetical protein
MDSCIVEQNDNFTTIFSIYYNKKIKTSKINSLLMNFIYLSIISSTFIIVGYLPEIYITIKQIKNVDSTKYSSTLWLIGGILGTVYSGINNADTFIIVNYSVNTSLNLLTLILKIYYYCHHYKFNQSISVETKCIHT